MPESQRWKAGAPSAELPSLPHLVRVDVPRAYEVLGGRGESVFLSFWPFKEFPHLKNNLTRHSKKYFLTCMLGVLSWKESFKICSLLIFHKYPLIFLNEYKVALSTSSLSPSTKRLYRDFKCAVNIHGLHEKLLPLKLMAL